MHETKNLKPAFNNVTISGLPGCGSTTLLSLLKEALHEQEWIGFSGGEFMRAYAVEKGLYNPAKSAHHSAAVYSDDFDRQVDYGMREKVKTQRKWIIESWLSGFMAQQVEGTLKVLLICSEDMVRIDRIINRDNVDVVEAKESIQNRYRSNLEKWQRMYSQEWQQWVVEAGTLDKQAEIDFWRPELYDLVIDTYSHNKEATLNLVLDKLGLPTT
jgi:cytidylate kinase